MKTGQQVKVKATGQVGVITYIRKYTEYSNSYALNDLDGKPIWNGNFRMFSGNHIEAH